MRNLLILPKNRDSFADSLYYIEKKYKKIIFYN